MIAAMTIGTGIVTVGMTVIGIVTVIVIETVIETVTGYFTFEGN